MLRRFVRAIMDGLREGMSDEQKYKHLVGRLKSNKDEEITLKDLNLVLRQQHQQPDIELTYYRLRKEYVEQMVMAIDQVTLEDIVKSTVTGEDNVKLSVGLKEIAFSSGMTVSIPLEMYNEFLEPIEPIINTGENEDEKQ